VAMAQETVGFEIPLRIQLHQPSRPVHRAVAATLPIFTALERGELHTVAMENRRTAIEMSRHLPPGYVAPCRHARIHDVRAATRDVAFGRKTSMLP
jgi:hypothetical protein